MDLKLINISRWVNLFAHAVANINWPWTVCVQSSFPSKWHWNKQRQFTWCTPATACFSQTPSCNGGRHGRLMVNSMDSSGFELWPDLGRCVVFLGTPRSTNGYTSELLGEPDKMLGGRGGKSGWTGISSNFLLLLFALHAFTRLLRSRKGNDCYACAG